MKTYTKESLIAELRQIRAKGWIPTARPGNQGGVGNTVEDLLGIEENNLPIPNAAEWELKAQRNNSNSLLTLFHMEPSPTAIRFVPQVLLPLYGWPHKEAGKKYSVGEMSFRQTINALSPSDRGFVVGLDDADRKVTVQFDHTNVSERHRDWLASVQQRVGLKKMDPYPYWGFDDLFYKVGSKLHNCFYMGADVKKINGVEHFHYTKILMLKQLSRDKFIEAIRRGNVYVDFDARTGHNHGTKFRIRQAVIPELYAEAVQL